MRYKKFSTANKIAFWSLIIGIIALIISFSQMINDKNIGMNQKTLGDKSPIINTEKDVNIKF